MSDGVTPPSRNRGYIRGNCSARKLNLFLYLQIMVTFYELKAAMPQGKSFDFAQLKDKVVLIVNTASKCGFTPQFEGLEKLYKDYSPRGLMVLGFPCNQFLSQDPGDDESIGGFCMKVRLLVGNPRSEAVGAGKGQYFIRTFMTDTVVFQNYGVSFPIMAKSDVNGEHANETFKFLKHEQPGLFGSEMISTYSHHWIV